jgi:hypothetical protein
MFGRRTKWIREHGEQAQGVITDVTIRRVSESAGLDFDMQVRIHYPEGTAADRRLKADGSDMVQPQIGETLPLRFDPEDRAKVVIDFTALSARQQRLNDDAIALAEADAAVPPDLRERGILGRATVQSISVETEDERSATITVDLAYRTDDNGPIRATTRQTIPRRTADQLVVGTIVTVRVDPDDLTRVAVSTAEFTPVVAVGDADMVGPARRAQTEGTVCAFTVQARNRQFLSIDGREMFSAKGTIDGTEVEVALLMPAGVSALDHGQTITGRRLRASPWDWIAVT